MERTTLVSRLDGGALRVLSVLGVVFASGALLWGVFGFVGMLANHTVPVTQPVSLDVAGVVTDGTASVTGGETTFAGLSIVGLSTAARLLLGGGTLILALVQVLVAVAVIALCRQLLAGRPFAPALGRLLAVVAVVILAGGMIGQALYGFGNFQVAAELNADPTGTEFPMRMHLDSTPFVVGIVVALIAAAFRVGERLQTETDGLV